MHKRRRPVGLAGAVRPLMDIYESVDMIKNLYFLQLIAKTIGVRCTGWPTATCWRAWRRATHSDPLRVPFPSGLLGDSVALRAGRSRRVQRAPNGTPHGHGRPSPAARKTARPMGNGRVCRRCAPVGGTARAVVGPWRPYVGSIRDWANGIGMCPRAATRAPRAPAMARARRRHDVRWCRGRTPPGPDRIPAAHGAGDQAEELGFEEDVVARLQHAPDETAR